MKYYTKSTTNHHVFCNNTFIRGFTIVELIVVIVIIAILATITVINYNGATKQAIEATMQTDLRSATSIIERDNSENGIYPSDINSINGGAGLKPSGDNSYYYAASGSGDNFCLTVSNPRTTTQFRYKSSSRTLEAGDCSTTTTVALAAGTGTPGYADGNITTAQFNDPYSVAVDTTGNIFVAEYSNHRIRKISTSGVVSTLAGSGTPGSADGTGVAAQFNNPYGLTIDSAGNIFVADGQNHRIRKVTPSGVVTTFAGSYYGYADGPSTTAQFALPTGIDVDSSGNVYVADFNNNRIRKITPSGVVSTLAGSGASGYNDGNGTAAVFNNPRGVTVDNAGNVYVADKQNQRIRKITASGVVTTFAGSGLAAFADGTGTSAQFNNPDNVAIDTNGNIFVSDTGNDRIRKITPTGIVTTIAGSGTWGYVDGDGLSARFAHPEGLAVSNANVIYVADTQNHRIRKITQE